MLNIFHVREYQVSKKYMNKIKTKFVLFEQRLKFKIMLINGLTLKTLPKVQQFFFVV